MEKITRVEEVDGKTRVYVLDTLDREPKERRYTLPDGCTVEVFAQGLDIQYLAQCGDPKALREMYSGADNGGEDDCMRRVR